MPKKIGQLTLFSIDDLHTSLGVSKVTLRHYLRSGKLKGRKLGVSWYVTEGALRDFFEETGFSEGEGQQNDAPSSKEAQSTTSSSSKKGSQNVKRRQYVVQGLNDLVAEQETCDSIDETLECLDAQPILSLFQVTILDADTGKRLEILKAKEFMDRYGGA
ncbi:MAG TPA: DNA-binding protein [Bacteroidetes bacterium]|nr:MAG: DNA-binding protein [Rhodothermaceae bacterium TMED105]RPF80738.1 MAG: DNA-binding protein [Rhodothermaceae bacterium TMED105]HBD42391.1 DNA-binding protein [Bacteroidota bacterium]|tara:strand:+ start:1390 stop:1869 length:480 start_codon:yes stop_codon:yes gene_type:complete